MRPLLRPLAVACLVLAGCASPSATGTPQPPGSSGSPGVTPTDAAPTTGTTAAPGSPDPAGPSPASPAPSVPASGAPPASASPSSSQPPTTGFDPRRVRVELQPFLDGLDQPVAITHAGDGTGTLYVTERPGRVLRTSADGSLGEILLDIRDLVDTQGERGLHWTAFHPAFEENGRFFVHYTDGNDRSWVVEYRAQGDGAVPPDSGRVLLRIQHPEWNHKGGWMDFGTDGMLYLAVGDGGGDSPGDPQRTGQDTRDLLASILRFDVDSGRPYGIPGDNPFAGDGRGADEVVAFGLRNPWRASFDRETGDLWIGDVGQDTSEEIDVIPADQVAAGLNFGWSDMEGTRCHHRDACEPGDYVAPVTTYGTDTADGCAVSGGYVYRGSAQPLLAGAYLFSDFCSGHIWGFDAEAARDAGTAEHRRLSGSPYNIVGFGEDEAGELFAVDLGGRILRVTAAERAA
jgi:glucose/arabinose dehydrogenase